ncbi:MAG: MFS transporter, partial [Halioglobus sp.]|nr:MFS transporter [Halioglobus sp.]
MSINRQSDRRVFYGWWIVAASMIGISTCPQPFVFGSLGLFMKPFAVEFGWSRSQISACITVFTVSTAVCFPLIGRLIDRFGARRVLLPSMFFLAACLAGISLFVTQIWHLALVFFLIGTLASGTNTVSYVPVISAWFDRHRGLAIGLSISGIGLGFFYVPLLVQALIDHYGWRAGYFGLSAVIILVAIPIVALTLRDSPAAMNLAPDGDAQRASDPGYLRTGLNIATTLRTAEFWLLAVTFFF